MNIFSKYLTERTALFFGFLIYFSVVLINDGFMALDEYWVGIIRYIPAQNSNLMSLVTPDDVKSPLQLLPMHAVAQLAFNLGLSSPYLQYRFVILILGLSSTLLLGFALFKFANYENKVERTNIILFFMMTFYFAAPFAVTRPMFESVAAPWLTMAAVCAYIYDRSQKIKELLLGVFFVSVAFVLRQQLGICALVFVLLPLLKKNIKHFFAASGLGLLFFILAGIPDYYIRGKFHYSLLNLTVYNYEHGAEYGNQSILFYPILILVVGFIPFFIKRYPTGFVKEQLVKYRSFYLILFLFVFLHSLFPNKWERFVISVLPILILILFPYLNYLQENYKENKLRLMSLYFLNFFLFVIASYFPPQKNLIEMSLYLDKHPEIKKIHRLAETPGWITDAFILSKSYVFIESDRSQLEANDWKDCSSAFVLGEGQAESYADIVKPLVLNAEFNVNLIDHWSYKLNPAKNARRVQLRLYSGCPR